MFLVWTKEEEIYAICESTHILLLRFVLIILLMYTEYAECFTQIHWKTTDKVGVVLLGYCNSI